MRSQSLLTAALSILICFPCDTSPWNAKVRELSHDLLVTAARAGGEYLVRMQEPDGSFHYYYDAAHDRFESRTYNIVRHAGAALSLLELYTATREARYLESARRAMYFLKTRFRGGRGHNTIYVLDYDGKAKLGANGLALVALAKQIHLDPKFADRKSAAGLANLILAMQRGDGSFETHLSIRQTGPSGTASLSTRKSTQSTHWRSLKR